MTAEQKTHEPKMAEHKMPEPKEIAGAWADVNNRVVAELIELSLATAKEAPRVLAELRRGTLDTLREAQTATVRWQALWPEAVMDPVSWYHKTLVESVEGAQRAFDLMTFSTRTLAQSADRLRASAEQAGQRVQDAVLAGAARTREAARRAA